MAGSEGMSNAWHDTIYPGKRGDGANGTPKKRSLQFTKLDATAAIPPRRWAYGNLLLFGRASAICARDGGGKGSLAVAIVLSMISGRPLLGEKVWRSGPAVIISYEDDATEWQRRIKAACMTHGVDYEWALTQIYFLNPAAGDLSRISFGHLGDDQEFLSDGDEVVDAVRAAGAAVLVIDPLNQCHRMPDGNNNMMLAQVAAEVDRVCSESGAAGLVLHHLRKSATGAASVVTMDDMMGALSLRATLRIVAALSRMTPKEGEAVQIKPDELFRYMRICDSKANYSPHVSQSTWFMLESVELGNGDGGIYPHGDNVQATVRWDAPKSFEGMDYAIMSAIFSQIKAGPDDKRGLYSRSTNATTRWVGNVVMEHADKSKEHASEIVAAWLKSGLLVEDDTTKDENSKTIKGVRITSKKAEEVLAGLSVGMQADYE